MRRCLIECNLEKSPPNSTLVKTGSGAPLMQKHVHTIIQWKPEPVFINANLQTSDAKTCSYLFSWRNQLVTNIKSDTKDVYSGIAFAFSRPVKIFHRFHRTSSSSSYPLGSSFQHMRMKRILQNMWVRFQQENLLKNHLVLNGPCKSHHSYKTKEPQFKLQPEPES